MIRRCEIGVAKDQLRLPDLLRILNLGDELPDRDGVKFRNPLRRDRHASCSFYDNCRRMMDWSEGRSYDAVTIVGDALGLKNGNAIRRFLEIADDRPTIIGRPSPIIQPQPKARPTRPKLTGLREATTCELEQIAASRNISIRAVEVAQDLGTLRVGEVCGYPSWVILDESGFCAEGRRINRKPYPEIKAEKIQLNERKAHTLRGSRKDWPVGILPTKEYRQCVEVFALVEGGPDYLAALHFALVQKRTGILPVTMLGRGACRHGLHPDSLKYFRGMRVRIYPHNDPDGGSYENTLILAAQLGKLGCEADCFVFRGLKKANGARIKDLNDCVEVALEHAGRLEELFP